MTTTTGHRYIVCDPAILGGEPIIVGTRTPVRAIVELWRMGIPLEQIPQHLPSLTAAQVFDEMTRRPTLPNPAEIASKDPFLEDVN